MSIIRRLRLVLAMGVIMSCLITASRADQINIDDFKRDAIRLEALVARARETLSHSDQDRRQLAELESQLSKLKNCFAHMADLVSQIQTKDGRIRYYLDSELGPKEREWAKQTEITKQKKLENENEGRASDARVHAHEAAQPDPKSPAFAGWLTEMQRINSEVVKLNHKWTTFFQIHNALSFRLFAALEKLQKELSEILTQREKLAKQLMEASSEFGGIRALFAKNATSLPTATTTVPLTAFPKGVSYEEANAAGHLAPRPLLPIGPGSNTRAIDHLRVITTSSEQAAVEEEEKRAKDETGYGFDTGGGLPPAPKIEVQEPPSREPEQNAKSEPPTPLVLVDPPTQHEKAVKSLLKNPC